MNTDINQKNIRPDALFGRISDLDTEDYHWGNKAVLFSDWGALNLTGYFLQLSGPVNLSEWGSTQSESIYLVEGGKGTIHYRGNRYPIKKGYAVKFFPGQNAEFVPDELLKLTIVQKPTLSENNDIRGEDFSIIKVINPEKVPSMVYEYETLGQEIFTCQYKNGLGLIKFVFPIDKIPLHQHPLAGRLIRTIWGKGYTYVEPEKYVMDTDTFALFPPEITHTNGPEPGNIYVVWAVQLPWVNSEIDENNIAGSENFVKYIGPAIPRELWKTKDDFKRAIRNLTKGIKAATLPK